jgi:hypothetical protein
MPVPKVARLPALLSMLFRTLPMACASFTIITPTEHTGVLHPVLSWKTKMLPNLFWFGGHSSTHHCHGDAFPSNAGLIFLTDELTNDRFLVDTGATFSIIACTSNSSPSGLFLKEQMDNPYPLGDSFKALSNFKENFLLLVFCKALWQVPFWALTF